MRVAVNAEPERLRYITQSILGLQSFGGLTCAALGLAILASDIEDVLPWRYIGSLLSVFTWVACFLAYKYVPTYYERRFGHVEPPKSTMSPRQAVILLGWVVL